MTTDDEALRVMLCAVDLANDVDLDKPVLELLEENKNLVFYASLLVRSQKGIRQRTLRRLLHLTVQLLYDHDQREGIFGKWLERKEDHVSTTRSNFFAGITVEDVREVLDVSARTAADYAKVVNWMGIWLL